MTKNDAVILANKTLDELANEISVPVAICHDKTIEKRLAWVFFYDSLKFLNTGVPSSRLVGNGPIVVMKIDGRVDSYGSMPVVAEILALLD